MIPSINPPTDSLYKLLSLFGLTIFLFYGVVLSDTYSKSSEEEIKIENLAIRMRKETGKNLTCISPKTHHISLRPYSSLKAQLLQLEKAINCDGITPEQKSDYINVMNSSYIKIDEYRAKIIIQWILVGIGIILMGLGFYLWHRKEQKLRNILLRLELEEKELRLHKLKNQNVPVE